MFYVAAAQADALSGAAEWRGFWKVWSKTRQSNERNHLQDLPPSHLWSAAIEDESFRGSPIDVADGFIHFSTAAQVRETAAKDLPGVPDLVLVAVPVSGPGAR